MTGLSNFSALNRMFQGRSGRRITAPQQRAANDANDANSMELDQPEARYQMRLRIAARGEIKRKMGLAYQAGDTQTYEALRSQLNDIDFQNREDARALHPRNVTADQLREASGRLPGLFRESALAAADASRAQADQIGGQVAGYNQRVGEGQMRTLGYDIPGERDRSLSGLSDTAIGPNSMASLGSKLSLAERRRLDPTLAGGVDVRAGLEARRADAASAAAGFDAAAERGFTPTPFDADALSSRMAADEDFVRRQAIQRQRERLVMEENKQLDFNAADKIVDIQRDTALASATGDQTGERARVAENRQKIAEATAREGTAEARAQAELDRALAEVRNANTENDVLQGKARVANAEADLTVQRMKQYAERISGGSSVGPSPEAAAGMISLMIDPMTRINEVVRRNDPGQVTFGDASELNASMDAVIKGVQTLKSAMASALPEDKQVILDEATKLIPFTTPDNVELVRSLWGDIANAAPAIDPVSKDYRNYRRQQTASKFNQYQNAMNDLRILASGG